LTLNASPNRDQSYRKSEASFSEIGSPTSGSVCRISIRISRVSDGLRLDVFPNADAEFGGFLGQRNSQHSANQVCQSAGTSADSEHAQTTEDRPAANEQAQRCAYGEQCDSG
jgi:hypothetical protein